MPKKPQVLLVHPGIQHAPRLAEELERRGMLARFWTGWADPFKGTSGKPQGKREVAIPRDKLRTRKWVELAALFLHRAGMHPEKVWHWRNATFQKLIPESEIRAADVVIGFDTASWILAERAKKKGKPFILEQSVVDPATKEEALHRMAKAYPDWAEEAQSRPGFVLAAERKEQALASHISVPSDYVKDSLIQAGVEAEKILMNPYGVGTEFLQAGRKRGSRKPGAIRFLFAGYVSGRKGVPLLLDAWSRLDGIPGTLTVVGNLSSWPKKLAKPKGVHFTGAVDRKSLIGLFLESDVFVFPSYAEGMPLVLLEAMATGLCPIASAVGKGLILDGQNGILLKENDPVEIAETLRRCAEMVSTLSAYGRSAHETAGRFCWGEYGERYARTLEMVE